MVILKTLLLSLPKEIWAYLIRILMSFSVVACLEIMLPPYGKLSTISTLSPLTCTLVLQDFDSVPVEEEP